MLKYLNIVNFAVIAKLEVEFREGFNLLTGETGTGKSIIVDALVLLLGRRVWSPVIRTGEKLAVVEGGFELVGGRRERVHSILAESGVEIGTTEDLLVRRELHEGGRSRLFVNEQTVGISTIKLIQPYLVEVLGQGEQQALAAVRSQLETLDAFAGNEELRRNTAVAFRNWREKLEALREMDRERTEREKIGDFLRFQLAEIEGVAPVMGEDERLYGQKTLLDHAEKVSELCASVYGELYEEDESILNRLGSVRRRIQELSFIGRRSVEWLELLQSALASLEEVSNGVRVYAAGIEFEPDRHAQIMNRLADLERLKRKYGPELEDVLRYGAELEERLEDVDTLEERRNALAEEAEATERTYLDLARKLSKKRHAAVPSLQKRVQEELSHLAMARARFVVSVETVDGSEVGPRATVEGEVGERTNESGPSFSPYGLDRVDFLLSANEGEALRPLSRVASGGELSRVMLALRTACYSKRRGAEDYGAGTLVFDEVDAGIGGKTAESVGRRLRSLAVGRQVLCVTHQPQIARFGDHHFSVEKSVSNGRTEVSLKELGPEERVGELARMIGGSESVEAAREAARWMVKEVPGQKGRA